MVEIPAGTFLMGTKPDPFSNTPPAKDQQPQRSVAIKSFALARFEITQEQWFAVMGSNPSSFKGAKLPVDQVTWLNAQEFISKLNAKTGKRYRLPTEAEWEYAARAGNPADNPFAKDPKQAEKYAWARGNAKNRLQPVGERTANKFGLFDMLGNAAEWVQDCYRPNYSDAPTDGTAVDGTECEQRVARGGHGDSPYYDLTPTVRFRARPFDSYQFSGLRVARDLP
jgi:formylglycine-generating enzyme required for sulfatase activity